MARKSGRVVLDTKFAVTYNKILQFYLHNDDVYILITMLI